MSNPRRLQTSASGFTLVELLIVLGILVVLVSLTIINLGQPQATGKSGTVTDTLLSDLKSQQLLSMTGDTGSTSSQQAHGIYVQAGQYTLFAGSSYSAGDTNNYTVTAPQNTSFSTSFPGSIVLFNKGAGDVNGYTAGSNTITVTSGSTAKIITISRFGATAVN